MYAESVSRILQRGLHVVINYKNWVWVASSSFPGLFPSHGGEGKSPGNEAGVVRGLCVNKMADAALSSEDEEIENPLKLQLAGELRSRSLKRLRFPERGK